MTIFAPDLSNGTMNTLLSNFENGNEINVWIGKSAASLTKVFNGVFENITVNELTNSYMEVDLDGPDWGSDVLKNRIVLYYKVQRYLSDNITLDPNDPNVTVSQITSDLITATLAYPFNDVTAHAQGVVFSTNNIDSSLQGVRIAQIMANMEHLDDKLSEVDNWCSAVHYIDPSKNFVMKPAAPPPNLTPGTNTPGTWLFTDSVSDSMIAGWTPGNVGYLGMEGSSYKYTTENYKARIIGIGGNQVAIDGSVLGTPVQQTTNSGSDNLSSTTWYAQKFTPVYANAYSIALYLALVGNPTVDLQIQIIQDNGGKPTGPVLATVSIPRSSIGSAGWYQVNIPGEYLTPNPYWIVLPSNPAYSALNTYTWYKGGTGFTNATSSDGITWTVNTGTVGYMFIEYTQTPLKQALPGIAPAANSKVFHEETYRQAFITTRAALMPYLVAISKMTNYKKEVYKCKVYVPDNVPLPFSSVAVRKISSGLAMNTSSNPASWVLHIIGAITFSFEATDSDTTGMLWMDVQLVRFTTFP